MIRYVFLAVLVVCGCRPSPQVVETAMAQTQLAIPTVTKMPTATITPRPSHTPTPSRTATPRFTATITLTATQTLVPTPRKPLVVDKRDFTTYPEKYVGEYVAIAGVVFNIIGNTDIQLYMGGTYDHPVYVVSADPFDDFFENDDVVVFGTADGKGCGTNAFGSSICQARIVDACVKHQIYSNRDFRILQNGGLPTPDFVLNHCP